MGALSRRAPWMSVRVCGGLRVTTARAVLGPRDLGGAKSRQVLLALLVEGGTPVSKARLIETLWGDEPPAGALSTLEAYVSVLRKRLATAEPGLRPVLTVPGGYRWDVDAVPVDLVEFGRHVAAAREAGAVGCCPLSDYRAAIDLVEAPLLPDDVDLAWLRDRAHVHAARVLQVLVEAGRAAIAAGDLERSEAWARRALELDPLLESAWVVLLETLERRGQEAEALREYDACRTLLAAELGCEPGPRLRGVFERLLVATSCAADGGLGELVEAVVRLHLALRDGHGAQPSAVDGAADAGRRGRAEEAQQPVVGQGTSLSEDCRRLRELVRAVTGPAERGLTRFTPMATSA